MEIINLIFSGENMRTVIILMAGYYFIRMLKFEIKEDMISFKSEIKEDINSFRSEVIKTIDEKLVEQEKKFNATLDDRFNQLKANDFAHLNRTIKALTFTLKKTNFCPLIFVVY